MDMKPDNQVRPDEPDERIASRQLSVSDADRAESGEAAALIAVREAPTVRRWPDALRWGTCLVLALCVHAAGAAALLMQWSDSADSVASAPVILIELAPVPVAPDIDAEPIAARPAAGRVATRDRATKANRKSRN